MPLRIFSRNSEGIVRLVGDRQSQLVLLVSQFSPEDGVVVTLDEDEDENGIPWLAIAEQQFTLAIDLSQLGPGGLAFDVGQLSVAAAEHGSTGGERVLLAVEEAERWGFLGQGGS